MNDGKQIREIFEALKMEIKDALNSNYEARKIRLIENHERQEPLPINNGDEFISHCEGKITALRGLEHFIEELEKRYENNEQG